MDHIQLIRKEQKKICKIFLSVTIWMIKNLKEAKIKHAKRTIIPFSTSPIDSDKDGDPFQEELLAAM